MGKPVFEDVFVFSGRRNRQSYVIYVLSIAALMVLFALLLAAMLPDMMRFNQFGHGYMMADINPGTFIIFAVIAVPVTISIWAVAAQRCRDFGWTGWAVLITLIPYLGALFGLALMFIPGTQGENRYGPDPLRRPDPV